VPSGAHVRSLHPCPKSPFKHQLLKYVLTLPTYAHIRHILPQYYVPHDPPWMTRLIIITRSFFLVRLARQVYMRFLTELDALLVYPTGISHAYYCAIIVPCPRTTKDYSLFGHLHLSVRGHYVDDINSLYQLIIYGYAIRPVLCNLLPCARSSHLEILSRRDRVCKVAPEYR